MKAALCCRQQKQLKKKLQELRPFWFRRASFESILGIQKEASPRLLALAYFFKSFF